MMTSHERETDRLRVLALRRREHGDDEPLGRPVEQLGFVLPELRCGGCTNRIISMIYWDADRRVLLCGRCVATLHRLDPEGDRFFALSIEARGRIPGMGFLPLGEARRILLGFSACDPQSSTSGGTG
jgi:hypothetical protein